MANPVSNIIFAFLAAAALTASPSFSWAQEKDSNYPEKRLEAGDPIPTLSFKDINGGETTNTAYQDWVIIYSFADRKSNKSLQEKIAPAGLEVVQAFPNLKTVYISIADVTMVPLFLRHVVTPVLKLINDKHTKDMQEYYKEKGTELDPEKSGFVMVPDWSGHYLRTFGLKNANKYHCFITYQSRVVAVLDSDTPDFGREYIQVFHKFMESQTQVLEQNPPGSL